MRPVRYRESAQPPDLWRDVKQALALREASSARRWRWSARRPEDAENARRFSLSERRSLSSAWCGLMLLVGSVDALPYLGPRLPVPAAGDEMVDRSFRWSDSGRSVFGGPPR
jgi:hypothetical protein